MKESLEELMSEIKGRITDLENDLKTRVDPMDISRTSKLPFKALCYRETLAWRMAELGRTAFVNFENDKFGVAILLTRAAIETSAALWFLCAKMEAAIDDEAVGDIDAYFMRLVLGSRTDSQMPQAINVLNFVDRVDKDIPGFRHQYEMLSEFSHPNWAGTTLLYSRFDLENLWADFAPNIREVASPRLGGVINLSGALTMFGLRSFSEIMKAALAIFVWR